MIRSIMDIFVLAEILVEVVGPAIHGEATTREQFTRHDRGIGVTKIRHHIRLPV